MERIRKRHREENSIQDKKNDSIKPLPYFALFQYSSSFEKCLIVTAVLLAVLSGCVPPIVNVLYGEFSNMLVDRQYPTDAPSTKTQLLHWFGGGRILQNASWEERKKALEEDSVAWGLGCAFFTLIQFLTCMLSVLLLNYSASQQISRIKILLFKNTLCKDMAWFDTRLDGNFAGKASEFRFDVQIQLPWIRFYILLFCWNLFLIEKGIADLLTIFTCHMTIGVINIFISFLYGWRLSLVLMTFALPLFVSVFVKAKLQSKLAAKEMSSHLRAGQVAEEVFSSIRTVAAFEGEKKEIQRYSKNVEDSRLYSIQRGIVSGVSGGILWLIIYSSYAVAFAYGIRLIIESRESGKNDFTPASLLIVFFGVLTGLTNAGFASAHIETFSVARGAAASVFSVVKTKPGIDVCSGEGVEGDICTGQVEFKNVYFEYPSRPDIKVLRGLNLKINAGEIVGIVGGSGAGKSTVLQLVQRLYDPSQGEILLDGRNIKSLKVSWLRQQLGVVGQEPLLFSTTIFDNILYGLQSASEKDVVEAAKKANAHDFIMRLNDNYKTVVGQRGSTLSGGQKQRIAIARALIRNPKILLLDEATSALDATSEKIVQAALDRASQGRTTLIVTHKLSTLKNADRIIVLANGVIAEEGTHNELVEADGIYNELLQSQAENIKEKKRLNEETPSSQIVYTDPTIFALGPRGRYSLSNYSVISMESHSLVSENKQYETVELLQIFKWNKPEWCFLLIGSLASIIGGAALPLVCILFGNLFGFLSLSDHNLMLSHSNLFAAFVFLIGVAAGVCVFLQMYCFAVAGAKLTTRLRIKAFDCMIHQEMGWFDDEKNKVGALCLRLSKDTAGVQGIIGGHLGVIMQAFSTMTIGTILSFFFDWKLTVVTLATVPFVFSGVYVESIFVRGPNALENKAMENASKIAVEVITNIKAVASLGKEAFFIEKYSQVIKEGKKGAIKKACFRGFAFAIGQTAPFFGYAVSLWYGGLLVAHENLEYKYVITISELLIFGAWTLGQCVVFAPSFGEAKIAAGRLQSIYTRKPLVFSEGNLLGPILRKDGVITYSKVCFSYPTRPGVHVLQNFNVRIKAGESVALTGPSGSGKSTIIQLLQRFYDPTSGIISINNVNIKDYNVSSLRRIFGLVSQEPVLFDKTIQENIAYGDNMRTVPMSEIIEAAKAANIHEFIQTLPLGYDTKLGTGGTQLSGGQKQRIAVARALVRNPQVLLLDEATSALDPRSENIVQNTLNEASLGRTTITVAHRLGAVRNANIIYVVEKGTIKECGTHEELMNLQGIYFSMHGGDDPINDDSTSKN